MKGRPADAGGKIGDLLKGFLLREGIIHWKGFRAMESMQPDD